MFREGLAPLKAMTTLVSGGKPDPLIIEIINTLEMFVDSFDKFIGVFDEQYSGGDFCAGITFGMQGTAMLEKVASTLYETHLKSKAQEARFKH